MASNVVFCSAPFKPSCIPHHHIGGGYHSIFHVTH
jgi:hypothetical protein